MTDNHLNLYFYLLFQFLLWTTIFGDNGADICQNPEKDKMAGPRKPPDIKVSYDGYPGGIREGTNVTINCVAQTGPKGTLLWVVYSKHGAHAISPSDSTVLKYSSTSDNMGGKIFNSTFSAKVIKVTSGQRFACFAYLALNCLVCKKTDQYCKVSQTIEIRRPKKPFDYEKFIYDIVFWILAACTVLAVGCAWCALCRTKKTMKKSLKGIEKVQMAATYNVVALETGVEQGLESGQEMQGMNNPTEPQKMSESKASSIASKQQDTRSEKASTTAKSEYSAVG